MMLWSRDEVSAALSIAATSSDWLVSGVSIDSRTLKPGDLFIALRGETHDGHDYIPQAIANGAGAVIVEHPVSTQCPVLIVPDTLAALTNLGSYRRRQTQARIVALTGSVGKTTTKEFLRHLCQQFASTAFSQSSYNNCWGVPLSLARIAREDAFGIFEIGSNNPGEIAPLAQLVNPHIALITCVGEAHIGRLGSLQAIAQEKGALLSGLTPDGVAVLNRDDAFFDYFAAKAKTLISYGRHERADVRLLALESEHRQMKMTFMAQEVKYECHLPFLGEHRALNALGAFAVTMCLGLDSSQVCEKLSTLSLMTGRGEIHTLDLGKGTFTLIDDAYNANPTSMRTAFAVCASLVPQWQGRRIVVLGEMGELGDYAVESHAALAPLAKASGVDLAFACGPMMAHFYGNLPASCQGGHTATIEELIPLVEDQMRPGDVILVKGSKSSRVNLLVEKLLTRYTLNSV